MHPTDDFLHRSGLMIARAAAEAKGSATIRTTATAAATANTTFPEQMDRWAELHRPLAATSDPTVAHVAALAKADAVLARSIAEMYEDDGA